MGNRPHMYAYVHLNMSGWFIYLLVCFYLHGDVIHDDDLSVTASLHRMTLLRGVRIARGQGGVIGYQADGLYGVRHELRTQCISDIFPIDAPATNQSSTTQP